MRLLLCVAILLCLPLFISFHMPVFEGKEVKAPASEIRQDTGNFFWADFDRDGLADLYVTREEEPGSLFHNEGNGNFEEASDWAEPSMARTANHALWGDYDLDGYVDIYLVRDGLNMLYRNIGGKEFVEVGEEAGVDDHGNGLSARWIDYDCDGYPDLELMNENENILFHNEGDGTFEEVFELGTSNFRIKAPEKEESTGNDGDDGETNSPDREDDKEKEKCQGSGEKSISPRGDGRDNDNLGWDPSASPDERYVNDGAFEVQGYEDIEDATIEGRHIANSTITGAHLVSNFTFGGNFTVNQSTSSGSGGYFYRDLPDSSTDSPVVEIVQASSDDIRAALKIQQNANSYPALHLCGSYPHMLLEACGGSGQAWKILSTYGSDPNTGALSFRDEDEHIWLDLHPNQGGGNQKILMSPPTGYVHIK